MGLESATYVGDLVPANPLGTDPKGEGDNHVRLMKSAVQATFPGFSGRFNRTIAKTTGAVNLNESHAVLTYAADSTAQPVAAATLGNGWMAVFVGAGGNVSIDPNASETINGSLAWVVPNGCAGLVFCDGTTFTGWLLEASTAVPVAQITANKNDFNPPGLSIARVLSINADARRTITGFLASGYTGKKFYVLNNGTFPIVFSYEDAASAAGNRFRFGGVLGGGQGAELYYDGARWCALSWPKPIGEIIDFGGANLPADLLALDQNVSRTTYASLFNEIGTTWGIGDGSTTFGLFVGAGSSLLAAGTGTHVDSGVNADVDTAADTLVVPSNTRKWITGKSVVFTLASGTITGLTSGNTYFVIRNSTTTIKLASSLANAQNGTAIDFTAKSTPVWTVTHTLTARTLGERGGEESHAMSSTELVLHGHTGRVNGGGGTTNLWSGAGAGDGIASGDTGSVFLGGAPITVDANGGNNAMNVMAPFAAVTRGIRFC